MRMRDSENATVRDLQEKNRQLAEAYRELQAAQAQLIEKEKLEHELQMARKIQENILPKEVPVIPGWQLAAYWQPARSVSGDFYDFIKFTDGRLGLLIADVTGKGMPAALVMATTRSVIRTVLEQVAQPGEVLAKVNDLLCRDMPAKMFVTCLYALLDPASGRLQFANAGHDLPFQRKRDSVVELRATGLPLGLFPGAHYEEMEAFLDNGDWLLLTSDGLVEAHNPQKEMFGVPRLGRLLSSLPGEKAQSQGPDLIGFLLKQLAEFTGSGWEQEDDVTLVTLERFTERSPERSP
jgi:serine phosphatase RsbU (regulator of sigma subunit)